MDMNLSKLQEIEDDREARCAAVIGSQRVRHDSVTEQQQFLMNSARLLILFSFFL